VTEARPPLAERQRADEGNMERRDFVG
jgi:hypothetical protein